MRAVVVSAVFLVLRELTLTRVRATADGKAAHALHAFPAFFYAPASVLASKTSVCDGFAAMREHKLAAIAVAFKDSASAHKLL